MQKHDPNTRTPRTEASPVRREEEGSLGQQTVAISRCTATHATPGKSRGQRGGEKPEFRQRAVEEEVSLIFRVRRIGVM